MEISVFAYRSAGFCLRRVTIIITISKKTTIMPTKTMTMIAIAHVGKEIIIPAGGCVVPVGDTCSVENGMSRICLLFKFSGLLEY